MKDEAEESDLIFGRHPVTAALKEGIVNKLWLLRGPGGSAVDELVRLAREQRSVV
jgi:tRNA G18 (ribose-2'-O)-methylase SpoU